MKDRPDPFQRRAESPSMIHRFLAGGLLGLVLSMGLCTAGLVYDEGDSFLEKTGVKFLITMAFCVAFLILVRMLGRGSR